MDQGADPLRQQSRGGAKACLAVFFAVYLSPDDVYFYLCLECSLQLQVGKAEPSACKVRQDRCLKALVQAGNLTLLCSSSCCNTLILTAAFCPEV